MVDQVGEADVPPSLVIVSKPVQVVSPAILKALQLEVSRAVPPIVPAPQG